MVWTGNGKNGNRDFGSKFIKQGEKNAVKYADEIIVLSKGVHDYFQKYSMEERHDLSQMV